MTVSDTTAETRTMPGRPRDPRVDEAIFAATLELLDEDGYAQLTVERIATTAGVGKASFYRRWPDKVSVVLEAVSRNPERPSAPDTGSLRGDMLAYLRALAQYRTVYSEAISAISGEALRSTPFAEAFHAGIADPVTAELRVVVQRAVDSGELPSGTDVELLASLPPSLLFMRRLLMGCQPDESFVERIVDQFFSPIGAFLTDETRQSLPQTTTSSDEGELL